MFTGIVEEIGKINSISKKGNSLVLGISCSFAGELSLGESVAVNGTCLTVTSRTGESFSADVTPESFRRTSLGSLHAESPVNLERAMKADGRFGGHIVSGHIDGTGTFVCADHEENAVNIKISVLQEIGRFIIEKGSVCVDGISLTVSAVERGAGETVFCAAVIPHTWKNTNLSALKTGAKVNIECDMVGKYVSHFLSGLTGAGGSSVGNSAGSAFDDAGSAPDTALDSQALESFMTGFTSFH